MTHDDLQHLKTKVQAGLIPVDTAMDILYQTCLKEIGAAYDKFNGDPSIPTLENQVE